MLFRSAELFRYLLDGYGVPRYLSAADRFAMKMGGRFSAQFPGVVMPMITSQLRKESSNVILPAEDGKLRPHLRRRRKGGIRMNINQLGEAILGESEAHHRLQQVVDRLTDKDCDYISVKISAIFSQIHLEAFEETVNDVLKNAIVNQLKKKFLEQQLQGALDNLTNSMGFWSGDNFIFDGLTDSEIAQFKAKVQSAANNFNQALGIYSDLFKDLTDEDDADTSLTGAVKGVSEETASLVAGQMNAIRINQLEATDLMRQQLLVLNTIAANTAFNKHLAKIDRIITILEANGGDSLRSQGLVA